MKRIFLFIATSFISVFADNQHDQECVFPFGGIGYVMFEHDLNCTEGAIECRIQRAGATSPFYEEGKIKDDGFLPAQHNRLVATEGRDGKRAFVIMVINFAENIDENVYLVNISINHEGCVSGYYDAFINVSRDASIASCSSGMLASWTSTTVQSASGTGNPLSISMVIFTILCVKLS